MFWLKGKRERKYIASEISKWKKPLLLEEGKTYIVVVPGDTPDDFTEAIAGEFRKFVNIEILILAGADIAELSSLVVSAVNGLTAEKLRSLLPQLSKDGVTVPIAYIPALIKGDSDTIQTMIKEKTMAKATKVKQTSKAKSPKLKVTPVKGAKATAVKAVAKPKVTTVATKTASKTKGKK